MNDGTCLYITELPALDWQSGSAILSTVKRAFIRGTQKVEVDLSRVDTFNVECVPHILSAITFVMRNNPTALVCLANPHSNIKSLLMATPLSTLVVEKATPTWRAD